MRDGGGSWYLYRVRVADGGLAFAAGGDGPWRHDGARWEGVLPYGRDLRRLPVALPVVGGEPLVVTLSLAPRMAAERILPSPELEVFHGGRWRVLPVPAPDPLAAGAIALDPGAAAARARRHDP